MSERTAREGGCVACIIIKSDELKNNSILLQIRVSKQFFYTCSYSYLYSICRPLKRIFSTTFSFHFLFSLCLHNYIWLFPEYFVKCQSNFFSTWLLCFRRLEKQKHLLLLSLKWMYFLLLNLLIPSHLTSDLVTRSVNPYNVLLLFLLFLTSPNIFHFFVSEESEVQYTTIDNSRIFRSKFLVDSVRVFPLIFLFKLEDYCDLSISFPTI
jgi:hypothetical protein